VTMKPFREPTQFPIDSTLFSAHTRDNIDVYPRCIPAGVTFVHENIAKPEELMQMWKQASANIGNFPSRLDVTEQLSKYTAFKASPPKLSVEPITHDDQGREIFLGSSFCGVIARAPIKKGELVAEYTGEMFSQDIVAFGSAAEYLWTDWPPVDSRQFRSAGSMINHAFPNTIVDSTYATEKLGLDGLPYRKMIIATDDIAEGEQIALNYGFSYEWNQPPIELRPAALIKFVKKHTWQSLMDFLASYRGGEEGQTKVDTILSILNSQSNLISLVKAKLIKQTDFDLIKHAVEHFTFKTDLKKVKEAFSKKEKF